MAQCVSVLPVNTAIANAGLNPVRTTIPLLGPDSTCSSGLEVLTTAEIQANKSQLTIDSSSNPERVADMQALFYAFLAVLVVVWGIKRLLDLFSGEGDK